MENSNADEETTLTETPIQTKTPNDVDTAQNYDPSDRNDTPQTPNKDEIEDLFLKNLQKIFQPDFNLPIDQVFHVLASRRIDANGNLIIGVPENELKRQLKLDGKEWKQFLDVFVPLINKLGLELVQFSHRKRPWICIRTLHPNPSELTDEDFTVLAVIIYLAETHENDKIETTKIFDFFRTRNLLKTHQIKQILRRLQKLGYIEKHKHEHAYIYGIRLKLEFNTDSRAEIAEQVESILL